MAGRAREGSLDEGRMLAAWEWASELEKATGCAVQVSLYRDARAGVWRVSARLLEVVDGRPSAVRLQVAGVYPNASRGYLGDYLLALVMQLDAQSARPVFSEDREA